MFLIVFPLALIGVQVVTHVKDPMAVPEPLSELSHIPQALLLVRPLAKAMHLAIEELPRVLLATIFRVIINCTVAVKVSLHELTTITLLYLTCVHDLGTVSFLNAIDTGAHENNLTMCLDDDACARDGISALSVIHPLKPLTARKMAL